VRKTAAITIGLTHFDPRRGQTSAWALRKSTILPALNAALAAPDEPTRERVALALFALGRRDRTMMKIIKRVADDPHRAKKSEFEKALQQWRNEQTVLKDLLFAL
jgi:hypothetical protein